MFLKELVLLFSNLDEEVLSNHLLVQCFDSLGSFAVLRGLLLKAIFQAVNIYHIRHLKTFAS